MEILRSSLPNTQHLVQPWSYQGHVAALSPLFGVNYESVPVPMESIGCQLPKCCHEGRRGNGNLTVTQWLSTYTLELLGKHFQILSRLHPDQ